MEGKCKRWQGGGGALIANFPGKGRVRSYIQHNVHVELLYPCLYCATVYCPFSCPFSCTNDSLLNQMITMCSYNKLAQDIDGALIADMD